MPMNKNKKGVMLNKKCPLLCLGRPEASNSSARVELDFPFLTGSSARRGARIPTSWAYVISGTPPRQIRCWSVSIVDVDIPAFVSQLIRTKPSNRNERLKETMPSDDYATIGGGALKLKGAKIDKKKKKKKPKTDLEKNLDSPDTAVVSKAKDKDPAKDEPQPEGEREEEEPRYQKTESELKYEEYKKKRVSPAQVHHSNLWIEDMANGCQLLKMAESSASRPELLKTHKERVEELNTYLSKLSEHHDMPKIGPG